MLSGAPARTADRPAARGISACTAAETWQRDTTAEDAARQLTQPLLETVDEPLAGLARAQALQRKAPGGWAGAFARYWIARSYQALELPTLAAEGFREVLRQAADPSLRPIAAAALQCLARDPADLVFDRGELPAVALLLAETSLPWTVAAALLRAQLAEHRPDAELNAAVEAMKGDASAYQYGQALRSLQRAAAAEAASQILPIVSAKRLSPALEPQRESLRLILARLYYRQKQFDRAAENFRKVARDANELPDALLGLSWSLLMSGKLAESAGVALSLEAGGLSRTFHPEALEVLAMAYHELCSYREAREAIHLLRRRYQPTLQWLTNSVEGGAATPHHLYPILRAYLRDRQLAIPQPILGEWIRSAVMQRYQGRINRVIAERQRIASLIAELPGAIPGDADQLRPVLEAARQNLERREGELVQRIEGELAVINRRLLDQLTATLDNAGLLEAAILNGASDDIVWQNAHPGFEKWERRQRDRLRSGSQRYVDWNANGEFRLGGARELWEDELGELKVAIGNRCSDKQEFLKTQAGKRSG